MRAFAVIGAAAVTAVTLTAAPAAATKPPGTSPQPTGFETVAGRFRVRAKADTRVARLTKKGVTGFVVEPEGRRFEVERSYDTRAGAKAEAKRVHKVRYAATVEVESSAKP